jgi:hypothetical protein
MSTNKDRGKTKIVYPKPEDYIKQPNKSKNKQKSIEIKNTFQYLSNYPPLSYKEVTDSKPTNPSFQSTDNYTPSQRIENIILTKFEYFHKPTLTNTNEIVSKIFFPDIHWHTSNIQKDRQFYELVLLDTQSAIIAHTKTSDQYITHSKLIIKKIITSTEWGSMYTERYFSGDHHPKTYTYRDYIDAWSRVLLLRPANHSWFIIFDDKIPKQFPIWFIEWWSLYGTSINILPTSAKQAFNLWDKNPATQQPSYVTDLTFFSTFCIPWILCWTYHLEQFLPLPMPFSLTRHFKTKFWEKFDLKLCSEENVSYYIKTGSRKYKYGAEEIPDNQSSTSQKKFKSRQNKVGEGSSTQSPKLHQPKKTKSQISDQSKAHDQVDTKLLKSLVKTDPKLAELYLKAIQNNDKQNSDIEDDTGSSYDLDQDSQDPDDY